MGYRELYGQPRALFYGRPRALRRTASSTKDRELYEGGDNVMIGEGRGGVGGEDEVVIVQMISNLIREVLNPVTAEHV